MGDQPLQSLWLDIGLCAKKYAKVKMETYMDCAVTTEYNEVLNTSHL